MIVAIVNLQVPHNILKKMNKYMTYMKKINFLVVVKENHLIRSLTTSPLSQLRSHHFAPLSRPPLSFRWCRTGFSDPMDATPKGPSYPLSSLPSMSHIELMGLILIPTIMPTSPTQPPPSSSASTQEMVCPLSKQNWLHYLEFVIFFIYFQPKYAFFI